MKNRQLRPKGRWSAAAEPLTWPADFDISKTVYDNVFENTTTDPTGRTNSYAKAFAISSDGKKLYVARLRSEVVKIFQYSLSVPYNISSASYDNKSTSYDISCSMIAGLAISGDGTMLITSVRTTSGNNYLVNYSISTPFDISTASFLNQSGTGSSIFGGFTFLDNGLKGFVVDLSYSYRVYSVSFTTKFDIMSSNFNLSKLFSDELQTSSTNDNGSKVFILDSNNKLKQYRLSTPCNIETASYDNKEIDLSSKFNNVVFSTNFKLVNGKYFYILNTGTGSIYQYKCY